MFRILFLLLSPLLLATTLLAQDSIAVIPRPEPKKLVNDLAGILNEPKRSEALEYKLKKLNDSLGIEIFIVTVTSIKNIETTDYTRALAYKWEDANDRENGIFILFDYEDRGYSIIPGTRFKDKFNNIIIGKIEDHYMRPHFKEEEFYEGFTIAADAIANHITGKLTDTELKTDDEYSVYIFTIALFIFCMFLFPIYQYTEFKKNHFGTRKISFISALMLMNHLKPAHSNFEDFKKGTGTFSVPASSLASFGGGAGGSWGSF